jgi:hypothetical protein
MRQAGETIANSSDVSLQALIGVNAHLATNLDARLLPVRNLLRLAHQRHFAPVGDRVGRAGGE